jgi:hypothetical protein
MPLLVLLFHFTACMKKQCYSCNTSYPELSFDSFTMQNRISRYCDITVERSEHLELTGNKDTLILVNGNPYIIKVTTTCEPD